MKTQKDTKTSGNTNPWIPLGAKRIEPLSKDWKPSKKVVKSNVGKL